MKKILFYVLIFILFIPFVVYAETCDNDGISIQSIKWVDKSDNVEGYDDATANKKNITLNLSMSDVGDNIKYEVVIKNDSNQDYKLDNNSFRISSDYVDYKISYNDGSNVVSAKSSKKVYLTVTYSNKVPDDAFNSGDFNDNKTITVELSSGNKIINPKTGVGLYSLIGFALLISFAIIYIVFRKKKYAKFMLLIIGVSIILPISVYAVCKYNINLESNITIKEKQAFLVDGKTFNATIKRLSASNPDIEYGAVDTLIKHISIADTLDEDKNPIIVSNDTSKYEVYAWYDNQTIYLYTEASKIYLDPDCDSMFYNLTKVLDIDLSLFDTSNVVNMYGMFWRCESIPNLDLSKFNTSNVTNMFNLFSSCYKLEKLDLTSFNTSNVTTMGCMFWGNYVIREINVSSFDTSKVTEFGSMFSRCYQLTELDLTSFSSSSAENVSALFYQDSRLATVYVSPDWNVTNVSGYSSVFNQSLVRSFTVVN